MAMLTTDERNLLTNLFRETLGLTSRDENVVLEAGKIWVKGKLTGELGG
jgi:hypothetical protein